MSDLRITPDPTDDTRLRLEGQASRAAVAAIRKAVSEVLATRRRGVVLELDGLAGIGRGFANAMNEIAHRAGAGADGQTVTLEVPAESIDLLDFVPRDPALRIEHTAPLAAPAAQRSTPVARHSPELGKPRREGAGFVTSYGSGRPCASVGCATTLSMYNFSDRCAIHRSSIR